MHKKLNKVFIMTTPRSGSTLLGQQLGINNRIFHIGESSYWDLLPLNKIQCSCGLLDCHFLSKIAPEIQFNHLAKPLLKLWQIVDNKYWPNKKVSEGSVFQYQHVKVAPTTFNYWLNRSPKALDNIISVYSKHTNNDIFVDNTKLHCIGEKLVDRLDWKIIVLLRDPRGIMCSYKLAGISKGDFRTTKSVLPYLSDFIYTIKKVVSKNNVKLVKYEDFCANPELVMKELCKFIDIPYDSDMSKSFTNNDDYRGHVIKGNRLLKENNVKKIKEDIQWKSLLTDTELEELHQDKGLVNSYREFGYTID